jgi:hypothetical protein
LFGFVQWDSPLSLLLEILLSVAVIVVVMWLARFANRADVGAVREPPLHERPSSGQTEKATRDAEQDLPTVEESPGHPSEPGHES